MLNQVKVLKMSSRRSVRVSKHSEGFVKVRAHLARGDPDYEAVESLKKGLREMEDCVEGLSIDVGDEEEEFFDEETEAQIDEFSKGYNGRETESPSKRIKPSPSGNESDSNDDEVSSEVGGRSESSFRGTTNEEACAIMDRGASPWKGDGSSPWTARSYLDGGDSRAVHPAVHPWLSKQSGGGAPAVVKAKAPVKKGTNVKIAPKQPKVRDLGVGFIVQPALVPSNPDPAWLEVSGRRCSS